MLDSLTLETVCAECHGEKGYSDVSADNGWAICSACGGTGYVPTAIGARILDLVRHNSRVAVSAELRVSGAAS